MAIKVGDCLNNSLRANIPFGYWDKVFHDTVWGKSSLKRTFAQTSDAVSYTHLTLPTIPLV